MRIRISFDVILEFRNYQSYNLFILLDVIDDDRKLNSSLANRKENKAESVLNIDHVPADGGRSTKTRLVYQNQALTHIPGSQTLHN